MMPFTQIKKTLWKQSWFKKLSLHKKALIFYLLTNPGVNYLGCTERHPIMIAQDMLVKLERVEELLDELEEKNIIVRSNKDLRDNWIFVRKFFETTTGSIASKKPSNVWKRRMDCFYHLI